MKSQRNEKKKRREEKERKKKCRGVSAAEFSPLIHLYLHILYIYILFEVHIVWTISSVYALDEKRTGKEENAILSICSFFFSLFLLLVLLSLPTNSCWIGKFQFRYCLPWIGFGSMSHQQQNKIKSYFLSSASFKYWNCNFWIIYFAHSFHLTLTAAAAMSNFVDSVSSWMAYDFYSPFFVTWKLSTWKYKI